MSKLAKKKLLEWQEVSDQLKEVKARELELRNEICSEILGDKQKGVMHLKKFGLDTAATAKLNMSIDKEVLQSIFKDLSVDEKACIRYKPEVKAKEYATLPDDSIFHKAVVTKPGTPALSIKLIE